MELDSSRRGEDIVLKIAVCDDVPEEIESITACVERLCKKHNIRYEISAYRNAYDLINAYQKQFDVIFLDIEMPELNGMEAARLIRRTDKETLLVFVTQMAQFAVKGYQVEALDFLVKPVEYYSFELTFRKILRHLRNNTGDILQLDTGEKKLFVPVSEIFYVEVLGHYVTYHTESGDVRCKGVLSKIQEKLDDQNFFLCNRYCLIHLKYVTEIRRETVVVHGVELEVSRSKRKDILHAMTQYMGGGL